MDGISISVLHLCGEGNSLTHYTLTFMTARILKVIVIHIADKLNRRNLPLFSRVEPSFVSIMTLPD